MPALQILFQNGCFRMAKDFIRRALFYYFAEIHKHNMIRQTPRLAQYMSYQNQCVVVPEI